MGENNKSSAQRPLHAVPKIFNAAMRTAFEIAAAFWRPWFREREKQEVPAPSEEAPIDEARTKAEAATAKTRVTNDLPRFCTSFGE